MKFRRSIRDISRRILYKKLEIKQRVFSFVSFYKKIVSGSALVVQKYFLFPIDSHKTRIHNFCVVTGRSRGIYRDFKLSRICLRRFGGLGVIFGLKKASW